MAKRRKIVCEIERETRRQIFTCLYQSWRTSAQMDTNEIQTMSARPHQPQMHPRIEVATIPERRSASDHPAITI